MKKYILLLLVGFFPVSGTLAQENTATNFYSINPQIINPALAGQQSDLSVYLNYRNQWYGVQDAPEYVNIGVSGKISDDFGIGLSYNNYSSGVFSESTISSAVSYGFKIGEAHNLRMGASFGIIRHSFNIPNDGVTDVTDIVLNSSEYDQTMFKVGMGINYRFKDIIQFDMAMVPNVDRNNNEFLKSFFIYASYDYKFQSIGADMKLTPAIMYRNSIQALNSIDFTLALEVVDKFWILTGYRNTSGLIVGAGIRQAKFAVGYTYEVDMSPMALVSNGSHEITVYYNIISKKKKRGGVYKFKN